MCNYAVSFSVCKSTTYAKFKKKSLLTLGFEPIYFSFEEHGYRASAYWPVSEYSDLHCSQYQTCSREQATHLKKLIKFN